MLHDRRTPWALVSNVTRAARSRLILATTSLLVLACGERGPNAADDSATTGAKSTAASIRTVTAAEWEATWARGGEAEDTLLLMPTQLAADSTHVYVLDPAGPRIVAFRASDGGVAWSYGRRGAGPGELRHPTAIAVSGTGELLVLDESNQRITVLASDGRFVRGIPLRGAFGFESLCGRAEGEVLLKRSGHRASIVRLARDGALVSSIDLPWDEGDAEWSAQWSGRLAGADPGDGCVLALAHGLGFTLYDATGPRPPVPYVEPFALPAVTVTKQRDGERMTVTQRIVGDRAAAIDAAVAGRQLFVLFAGESRFAYGIIDVYALPSGAYERSYSYAAGIERIAVAGGMLYALGREGDIPLLAAYHTGWPATVTPAATSGAGGAGGAGGGF